MNIGYIGLGHMGAPCVVNLLKTGYPVSVWARNPKSATPVLAKGAVWCANIIELAKKVDVLFTNVTDSADVEEILLGEKGVIHSKKTGLTVIDMSTISAMTTREIAKQLSMHSIEFIDAPVSGGTTGAQTGSLTIMVGATAASFEKIKPLLSAMGKNITRIGDTGAGQIAKSCNQIIITGTIAAVAEALTFATATGVDFHPIREALLGGFAKSSILEMHGVRMMDDNYTPGFKTVLHSKDMGIVKKITDELGINLSISKKGIELLHKTIALGYGEADSSAMVKAVMHEAKK